MDAAFVAAPATPAGRGRRLWAGLGWMLLGLLIAVPSAYGAGASSQRDVNPSGGVLANGSDGLRVYLGSNSQFQVNLGGSGQTYSQAGTPTSGNLYNSVYLRVDRGTNATTRVYTNANNASSAPFSTFTQVSQSAISGSGTAASPWVVTTVLRPSVAADSGITVTLTDSYVRPQGWFTRRVDLSGLPTSGATIKFYQNVDTFLQGGDNGPGFTRTSPGNTSGTPDVVGVIKNSQFEALWYEPASGTPIWDRYFTGTYSQPSNLICNGTTGASNPCVTGTGNLNNTVDTNANTDNGMAAQWNLPAGVSAYAVEYRVTFAMGAVDLTKGFSPGTIGLNGISTLTFNFSNKTVNPVSSMNFVDTLPTGLVVAPVPNVRTNCPAGGALGTTFPSGMTVTAAAGSGTIQLAGGRINGAAAAGGEIACQLTVDVTSPTAGVYHNTNVSISGINNLTNLVGDELLAVGIPQLVAGKSVSGGLAAGQAGTTTDGYYVLSVQNTGAGPTFGAINLVDNLPPGVIATAVSSADGAVSCGTLPATGTLTCSFAPTTPIPVGGTASVRVNVAIPGTATGSLTNLVGIGGGGDPDPLPTCPNAGNVQCAQNTTPLSQLVDLSITKTDGRTTYTPGSALTYTIVVSNAGPSNAVGASVTDTFPAAFTGTWTCVGAGGASCPASGSGNINATVSIPSGASVTFTVSGTVSAAASGNLSNTASVAAPAGLVDPTPANNTATDVDTAAPSANLSAVKTGPASIGYGGALTYSVVVTNAGPSNADGASFSDTLPAGITNIAASCGAPVGGALCGTVNVGGSAVSSTIASLPANGSVTFTITGTAPTSGTSVTNTASAQPPAGTTDPVPGNNTGTATTTLLQPQLTVSKSATPNPFTVGQPGSYTITVSNTGAGPTAGNVTVADTLPAGITLVGASGANWSCSGTTAVSCVYGGTLAAGASTSVTLQVAVSAGSANGNNTATASGGGDPGCPAAARCSGTTTVPVNAAADIVLGKTVDNATPNVGETVTFTVTASNAGPSNATGVAVSDALPAGLSFVSATPSQGSYDSATGLWAIGALANGAQATLSMTAQVLSAGALSNTATRSAGDQFDPNTGNNAATASLNAQPSADLQVSKTASTTTPNLGSNVTFTITVHNGGPNDASGVVVDDALPAGLNFVSATPSQGSYDAGTGLWTVGALGSGVQATLTMVATVGLPGELTNTASIAASDQHDPNPANDSGGVTINGQAADLQVLKTVDAANPTRGDTVTFTVTVTNLGPSAASGVRVEDALPAGLSFVSATPSQGSYDAGTGLWTVGNLAASGAGAVATLTLAATVDSDAGATNLARLDALDQTDPNPANNQAQASVTPIASADVSVTKSGPATVDAAGTISYTLVVSNAGPSDADGTTVSDPLPAGLSNATVNCTGNGGAVCGAFDVSVAGTLTSLPAGGSATITITATAPNDASTLSNTASVAPPPGTTDPDPSDNTTPPVQTQVTPVANLSLLKSGPASVSSGGAISYTLLIANAGPSAADGASYSDVVPSGITGVAASCGSATGGAVCAVPGVAGNTVSGSIPTLPASGSVTITITGIAPIGTQTLTNTAGVTVPGGTTDPTPGDDTSTVTTQVGSAADIAVGKTVDNAAANVGETVTFTVTATNQGPDDATGVQITDGLPAGLALLGATPSQGIYDGTTGLWTVGALADGASATLTVTATVTQLGAIVNTATRTGGDQLDPNSSNNAGSAGVNAGTLADLQVDKTVDTQTPNLGSDVSFTITVRNAGPSPATGVNVSDVLPAGLAFVTATPSLGAYDETTGVWAVGDLAAGAEQTLTIVATVTQAGAITNTATGAANEPDPNPANNQSGVTPNGQAADLQVVKTVDQAEPRLGQNVTFTVTLTNLGPNAATNVRVDDALPAGLSFVGATPSQGIYDPGTGVWTVGDLAASGAGAVATLTVTATVTQTGAITNVASSAGGDQTDPTPSNDQGSATVTVPSTANLSITKSGPATVGAGGTISYALVIANAGPDAANGASYSDEVPAGISGLGASCGTPVGGAVCAAPTVSGNTVSGSVPTLPANGSVTITITGTAPADASTLTNTATVTPPPGGVDPDPSDDTSPPVHTQVTPVADLSIVKTGPAAVAAGGTVTYTLTVANAGPSSADGATVSDPLPAGLTNATASCGGESGGAVCGGFDTAATGTIATLPAGGSATITITATAPSQAGTLRNTATVAAPAGVTDPQPANDTSATVVTEIGAPMADLSVRKSGPATIAVGNTLVYTVVVSNAGPDTAVAVQVADPLPPGLVFVGNAGACTTAYPCALGDLASGASATITSTYAVPLDYAGPDPIANTASASSSTADPNPADNSATAQTSVDTGGQLADMRANGAPTQTVAVGTPVTVVTSCTNDGPLPALDATCTVIEPVAPAVAAGTPTATQCTPAMPVASLAVGATITCTTQFTPTSPGTWTLQTIAASRTPDAIPANDVAQSQVIASAPDVADLSVSKQGPATASAGGSIVYTLSVTNHGPAAATDVILDDPTPAGLRFVSADAPCEGGFPCAIGTLASGRTATFTATYAIDAGFSGTLTNTLSASSSTPDPDPANDSSSSATTVRADPPVQKVPVPVDARWMLALMGLLLTLLAGVGLRRRRG